MTGGIRIGVDIGGTFTDFVLHDATRELTHTGKRLTTPEAPSRAIIEGIERLLSETGGRIGDVDGIVHGTTMITNTVLERTGAKVGLLASLGFRDILEMGREIRYDVDDLMLDQVPVLVPRRLRLEVAGRLLADGSEHVALDHDAVRAAVRTLVEENGIEALAIGFMHSYRNPAHERQAGMIAAEMYPSLPVSLSAEVAPEIREYERINTACVNAYVQPRVRAYLDRLEDELASLGFAGSLHIMLSGGGVTSIEDAKRFPVRLIESGPAAGAMAAAYLARACDEPKVVSFDMGGTTAKMCLIDDFTPHLKHDFEAGRLNRFKAGSGLPLKVTVVDMIEIGAGGGSIAAVDALGLLKVGPRSAASVPGPVCYGRGGLDPTVTDADLLLGYLNPDFFLGGEMPLNAGDVRRAVTSRLSEPLRLDDDTAVRGIRSVVDESMAAATRMHMAEKGKDPRTYTMIAFGGAGPVHAYALARLLKIPRLIVPMGAGVISALGFLVAPPAVDGVRGYVSKLAEVDWTVVNDLFDDMSDDARRLLRGTGDGDAVDPRCFADMRYAGQGFEVTTPIPAGPWNSEHASVLRDAFVSTYAARFGRAATDLPVEVINWRLAASLPGIDVSLVRDLVDEEALRGVRPVYFAGFGVVETRVFNRYALAPGMRIEGPAVFEERESSFAVGPDCTVLVDRHFNLVTTIRPQSPR